MKCEKTCSNEERTETVLLTENGNEMTRYLCTGCYNSVTTLGATAMQEDATQGDVMRAVTFLNSLPKGDPDVV